MTDIKATCPVDGEVMLEPADLTLSVCAQRMSLSNYTFACPVCAQLVRKPADEHIIGLLAQVRVPTQRIELPLEVLEDKPGPALTYDDLLDFILALQGEDLLAAFATRP